MSRLKFTGKHPSLHPCEDWCLQLKEQANRIKSAVHISASVIPQYFEMIDKVHKGFHMSLKTRRPWGGVNPKKFDRITYTGVPALNWENQNNSSVSFVPSQQRCWSNDARLCRVNNLAFVVWKYQSKYTSIQDSQKQCGSCRLSILVLAWIPAIRTQTKFWCKLTLQYIFRPNMQEVEFGFCLQWKCWELQKIGLKSHPNSFELVSLRQNVSVIPPMMTPLPD